MFDAGCCARIVRGSCGWSGDRPSSRPQVRGGSAASLERLCEKNGGRSSRKGEGGTSPALDETIDRGTRFIAEKTVDAEAAVKAGRETMKENMDKCCN
jgi:hypothetical protein